MTWFQIPRQNSLQCIIAIRPIMATGMVIQNTTTRVISRGNTTTTNRDDTTDMPTRNAAITPEATVTAIIDKVLLI